MSTEAFLSTPKCRQAPTLLKYAVGQAWCSEADLFGDATVTEKADRLFQFDDGYEYEVELIAQRGGNLPTNRISRGQF
jgi:hypothetical protein